MFLIFDDILGISSAYLGDILGISWGNLGLILGISWGVFWVYCIAPPHASSVLIFGIFLLIWRRAGLWDNSVARGRKLEEVIIIFCWKNQTIFFELSYLLGRRQLYFKGQFNRISRKLLQKKWDVLNAERGRLGSGNFKLAARQNPNIYYNSEPNYIIAQTISKSKPQHLL